VTTVTSAAPAAAAQPRRRLKVTIVVDSLAKGGAERQAAELARQLPRDAFDVVLCTLRAQRGADDGYGYLLPSDLRRFAVGRTMLPFGFRSLRAFLAAERPDIVHSFLDPSNFWSRLLARGAGDPVVISSVRCRMMRIRFALCERLLARRCDAVVVNSVGIVRELVRWQRVPPDKIRLVGNIVDAERFRPQPPAVGARVRAELGLGAGPTFLLPGRISVMKHQLGAVAALGRLKRRGQLPRDATLVLAGHTSQGLYDRALRLLVRRHSLDDQVRRIQPVVAVEDLYAAADWVLLPSLWEGLPNAALEAHACERPLLLSHAANLDAIAADGETGHEFPTGRVAPLAAAIRRALDTPPEEARAMGARGRQRILARFAAGTILGQVIALYDELLARRGRAREVGA
jgi:glycosyltransferase involved in cell wall biosynthesis